MEEFRNVTNSCISDLYQKYKSVYNSYSKLKEKNAKEQTTTNKEDDKKQKDNQYYRDFNDMIKNSEIEIFVLQNSEGLTQSHILNPQLKRYNKVASEIFKRKLNTYFEAKDIYSWSRSSKDMGELRRQQSKSYLKQMHHEMKQEKIENVRAFFNMLDNQTELQKLYDILGYLNSDMTIQPNELLVINKYNAYKDCLSVIAHFIQNKNQNTRNTYKTRYEILGGKEGKRFFINIRSEAYFALYLHHYILEKTQNQKLKSKGHWNIDGHHFYVKVFSVLKQIDEIFGVTENSSGIDYIMWDYNCNTKRTVQFTEEEEEIEFDESYIL